MCSWSKLWIWINLPYQISVLGTGPCYYLKLIFLLHTVFPITFTSLSSAFSFRILSTPFPLPIVSVLTPIPCSQSFFLSGFWSVSRSLLLPFYFFSLSYLLLIWIVLPFSDICNLPNTLLHKTCYNIFLQFYVSITVCKNHASASKCCAKLFESLCKLFDN